MDRKTPREWVPRIRRKRVPLTDDERRLRDASRLRPDPQVEPPFQTRYTMNRQEHIEMGARYGPFSRTISVTIPSTTRRKWHKVVTWYRSKTKRRKTPNPYTMRFAELLPVTGGTDVGDAANSWAYTAVVNGRATSDAMASNKARSRFVSEVRDSNAASLAVTLAEWGQSHRMIVHRASQLLAAAKAARRLDPKGIQKALGIQKMPKGVGDRVRSRGKSGANLWLEYSFGWKPMVQDIYEAVKVLSSNPPTQKVAASGRCLENVAIGNFGQYAWTTRAVYNVRVKIQADVYISNPNLALANQLGIVNPATVAWELVPFSFLVDWFIPVGKMLDSWSDLLGYKIEYPFTTTLRECTANLTYPQSGSPPYRENSHGVGMLRTLGIPPFRMTVPPFQGFSVARGANAISLVVQQFLQIKK